MKLKDVFHNSSTIMPNTKNTVMYLFLTLGIQKFFPKLLNNERQTLLLIYHENY